ncbi:unnamed protein product [Urochloa decumbens]|uniref:DUF1618 domain-containing protein n=1 Tax=Urochloa decumbens TaxID=240449 RepID=A0ABC9FVQ4_9POAL
MAVAYHTLALTKDPAPEAKLEWAMFDRRVIQGQFPFSASDAFSKTSNGRVVRVSLRFAPPPLVSYVQLYTDDVVYGGPPKVVSADGDLLLIQMVVAVPDESPSNFPDNFFVYKASPEWPQLYALPTLGDDWFGRCQPTGIFHSGGDDFFAANLQTLVGENREEVAQLFRYSSLSKEWKLFHIDCPQDPENGFYPICWHTDSVFCYGEYMCWADYHQGIVYCDVSTDVIELRFVRFPGIETRLATCDGHGLPERVRTVAVNKGKIWFINIDDGRFSSGGRSECSVSMWTLKTLELKWEKEHTFALSDLWSVVKYQQSPLPQSVPGFPLMDLHEDGVLHFIVRESIKSELDWRVTINVNTLALDYEPYLNAIEEPYARRDVKNKFYNSALLASKVCQCLDLPTGRS